MLNTDVVDQKSLRFLKEREKPMKTRRSTERLIIGAIKIEFLFFILFACKQ